MSGVKREGQYVEHLLIVGVGGTEDELVPFLHLFLSSLCYVMGNTEDQKGEE